jgi:hypothetical protein
MAEHVPAGPDRESEIRAMAAPRAVRGNFRKAGFAGDLGVISLFPSVPPGECCARA